MLNYQARKLAAKVVNFSSDDSSHTDDSFNSSIESGKYVYDNKKNFFNKA